MKKGKPDNDEEIDDQAENEDSAPGPVVKRARSKGPVTTPSKKVKTLPKKRAVKMGAAKNGRNKSKTPAKKGSGQNSTTNVSTQSQRNRAQSQRNTVKVKKPTPVSAE